MKKLLILSLLILFTTTLMPGELTQLETLRTLDGEVYKKVKITKIYEDSISITHESGIATLFLVKKPLELKKPEKTISVTQIYHESDSQKLKRLAGEQNSIYQKTEKQKTAQAKIDQLLHEIENINHQKISALNHKRQIASLSLPRNPSKTQKLNYEEEIRAIDLEITDWKREIELKAQKISELK